MSQHEQSADGASRPAASSRHQISPGLRGASFDRVIDAWTEAREHRDPRYPPLRAAVGALATHARSQGISVGYVLRALNAVIDPRLGGDPSLMWDNVRECAGEAAIASYYRDD